MPLQIVLSFAIIFFGYLPASKLAPQIYTEDHVFNYLIIRASPKSTFIDEHNYLQKLSPDKAIATIIEAQKYLKKAKATLKNSGKEQSGQ